MTAKTDRELAELRANNALDAEAFEADPNPDAVEYVAHQRRPHAQAYSLRMPSERIEQLRAVAEARGIDASALARQWIIERLDSADRFRDGSTERWERDVRTTTKSLQDDAEHLRRLLDERPGA